MTPASVCSLSLDLDDEWSYLKTAGREGWQSLPSYLDRVVPRVLSFMARRHLTLTVFVVGQDAALPRNRGLIEDVAAAGHEIGNHSFAHEPWLHLDGRARLETDLVRAEEHIERIVGQRPVGFRAPGYSLSAATVAILLERGYRYDASSLPSVLGPLARAYYFARTGLRSDAALQRRALFGRFRDGLRPIRPYRWRADDRELLEIPVTTMPFIRVPIHASYVLYLSARSPALARAYFRVAMALCAATGTAPSILFHPLDFLGGDEAPALGFFPGMHLSATHKLRVLDEVLDGLLDRFRPVTLAEHARLESGQARSTLDVRLLPVAGGR
jgi:peptidoglycan/xylan/chitin deacetylase (PgdA/CDA1 family)